MVKNIKYVDGWKDILPIPNKENDKGCMYQHSNVINYI
jgi:hypothetical protein